MPTANTSPPILSRPSSASPFFARNEVPRTPATRYSPKSVVIQQPVVTEPELVPETMSRSALSTQYSDVFEPNSSIEASTHKDDEPKASTPLSMSLEEPRSRLSTAYSETFENDEDEEEAQQSFQRSNNSHNSSHSSASSDPKWSKSRLAKEDSRDTFSTTTDDVPNQVSLSEFVQSLSQITLQC